MIPVIFSGLYSYPWLMVDSGMATNAAHGNLDALLQHLNLAAKAHAPVQC